MGNPKLSLPIGPETMLGRVVRILNEVVSPVVVVAAGIQDVPKLPDHIEIVRDEQENLGPMGGLAVGLAALRGKVDAAYVSACDTPFLQPAFVRYMINSLEMYDLAIPRDGKYHHPLAAIYRTHLEDKVRSLIAQERLRPIFLVEESNSRIVDVEELRSVDPRLNSLRNTNTPEDYQSLLREVVMPNGPAQQRDVRMRGFTDRVRVEEALEWVDEHAKPLKAETIELASSQLRVLGVEIAAPMDVPPFDRAAMDGFALKGAETTGAGNYNPLSFRMLGESTPGRAFDGEVAAGTAIRIMTGAPIPDGADAVLPAEFAHEEDGQVEITTAVSPGKHVGRRSEDVAAGTVVLQAGRRLRPQDVSLLSSLGIERVQVIRKPNVRVLVTGNELVAPGQPRGKYQIFESNSILLQGLIERDGGRIESKVDVEDDSEAIRRALTAAGADIVLVSGGSSVGQEDHAPPILAQEGELAIHGIAMRPSSPTGMGLLRESLVFLLPGNPVSCLCAYDFFAGRAIRLMGGRRADWPYGTCRLQLSSKVVSAIGRVDYCRVRLADGEVQPLSLSGASILSSTTRADGFLILPAECEGYAAGTDVNVYQYDPVS